MTNNTISSDIISQRQYRIDKLNTLRELGIDPFPPNSTKDYTQAEVISKFDELSKGGTVNITGRITSVRDIGNLIFMQIKDQSGTIQAILNKKAMQELDVENQNLGFKEVKKLVDIYDIVQVGGTIGESKTGEKSIIVDTFKILTKSIRPMPDELEDKETRFRKRYLDINLNDDVKQRYERRAKYWEAHREFFKQNGFMEMNIPVLEHTTGGADANPFVTHMDALDEEFYLRISQELYLKRLIGAGYEKVFEIGPRFRNEGMSDEHLPEHMAMEYYWAYADYNDGMKFQEEMFRYVAEKVWGTLKFNMKGFEVDLSKPFEKIEFEEIIKERYDINVFDTNVDEIKNVLKSNKIEFDEKNINISRGLDTLWKQIRKTIGGPVWMIHEPKFLSPLSKSMPGRPEITQRIHPVIAGSELGNGFTELNDPIDQYDRFKSQEDMRDAGDDEAHMMDTDFVEMLEYGMSPTFGWGHSERNFWFFEDVSAREGVPFPQMRRVEDEINKKIWK